MNKLIVLGGFAGAGKSTIAKRLASQFNYPVFSSDDFNDALRPLLNKSFHETSPIAYDTLWFILKKNLRNGVTCIFDANMCSAQTWNVLDQLKDQLKLNTQVLPIILECTLETHNKRISHRGATDKEHLNMGGDKLDDADVRAKYEFINNLKRPDLFRIDANGTIDEVYTKVIQVINQG